MAEVKPGATPGEGAPQGAAPSAAPGAAGAKEGFDLDAWLKEQPQEALEGLSTRFANGVNAYLAEQYGDVLPIIEEITKDEKLRGNFKKLVREGKVDRDELEFLLDTGIVTYEEDIRPRRQVKGGPGSAPQGGSVERDPNDPGVQALSEVERLKEKLQKDELADNQAKYEQYRRNEVVALMKERPDLAFKKADETDPAYRRIAHIAEVAEARTKANYERGMQKVVSYKEVADELDAVLGRETPPAAPRTTTGSRIDDKPQAPKTVAESKERMREQLAKAGGFRALAEASRRG